MAEQKDNPKAQDKKELKKLRDLKPRKEVKGGARPQGQPTSDLLLVKSIF